LLDLISDGLRQDPELERLRGYVEDTGEGRWTIAAAIDEDVPAGAIAHALFVRFRSREEQPFSDKMLAMLRLQFGGHAVRQVGEPQEPARQ
jgi:6-phosphogluconate dehydrogenase